MESEQHHYNFRRKSRSRSHTPMVPNLPVPESEVTEHHYDLRSKSRERSHTPAEITSSRRSGSRSLTGSSSKMHEKSMETIEESKEGSVVESVTDNQSTKSESSTVITKKAERRSERQRAKRQIFANGQSESKENESNEKTERKRKSITPCRILTSDYSSEEGEREDPPNRLGTAYEIYKKAGEWWNVFPKTDYTYSQASQCRYEIAPGVLAMPNMSRRSIHTDDSGNNAIPQVSHQSLSQTSQRTTESGFSDATETGSLIHLSEDDYNISRARTSDPVARAVIYRKTHMEQYKSHKEVIYSEPGNFSDVRQRYPSWSSISSSYIDKYGASQFDSDTELDENLTSSSVKTNQISKIAQWFTYFTTFITIWFKKSVEFFKFRSGRRIQYYGAQAHRSYHESKWSVLWKSLDRYSHNIYFLFVRILVFDAWLLSQFTGVRKWLQGKGAKILWITLLPLLLLLGCWCIAQCLSLFPAKTISNTETEKLLLSAQWNDRENQNVEEKSVNNKDLVDRIETLEDGQKHQLEYFVNITLALEDRKQSDADFRKEYNDKIANVENKLDISDQNSVVYKEIKIIKYEFEKLRRLYSQLRSCCNAHAESVANQDIQKHVEKILSNYFPPGTQNLLAQSGEDRTVFKDDSGDARTHISDEHVRKIVREVLRIYDADKTGRVDYALESAGGQIISTRCTQRYDIKSRAFSLFGIPLYYESNDPRTVIQGKPVQPGACWAFQDFPGYLLIQLRSAIHVTGFTLEHVSRLILPDENMSSAPKKFDVWGLVDENDPDPVMFGDYEFTNSDDSLQYFSVQNMEIKRPYEYIELKIHSNHGQLDYTCLYRFRVHGKPA